MVREAFHCWHCGLRVQPHRSNPRLRAGSWLSGRPDPNPHGYCFGYEDGTAVSVDRVSSASTGSHVPGQTGEPYCRGRDCCYLDSVSSAFRCVGLPHVRVGTRLAVVRHIRSLPTRLVSPDHLPFPDWLSREFAKVFAVSGSSFSNSRRAFSRIPFTSRVIGIFLSFRRR